MHNAPAPVILFLCDYQAPYGGNFIASLTKLDEALHARGAQTIYMFPTGAAERDWYRRLESLGFTLAPLSDAGMRMQLQQLVQCIDSHGVTILHVHFGLFPLAEIAALRRRGLRLILHFHSDFSAGHRPGWKDRLRNVGKDLLERCIGRRRITKITVSERSARTTDDCIALHNALVPERFASENRSREQTRAACRMPDDATLVLVFGWSPFVKGVDVAAQAVRRLQSNGQTQFLLGIVCGRTVTEARMRAFLREHAGLSGDEPWLRYLAPVEDVFRYHKAADIMLSASRSETFSYALLEAVYTGRPCAASDIPGVRWAETFDTVRFFASEDDAALAETLLSLDRARQSDAWRARLSAASARAQAEFAIEDWICGMLSIYGVE